MAEVHVPIPAALSVVDTVRVDGVSFSIAEIADTYAESEYGQYHAGQNPRFAQYYGYEPDRMLEDLGNDVHPVRHMVHTEGIFRTLMQFQGMHPGPEVVPFTDQRQVVVNQIAAIVHDMGENEHPAIAEALSVEPVGDKPKDQKTSDHEAVEARIRQHLYNELYPDDLSGLLADAEAVLADPESFDGRAFETTEYLGYYQTAMAAGQLALAIQTHTPWLRDTHRFNQLVRLAQRVSNNWHDTLAARAAEFPIAGATLHLQKQTYRRIHRQLPDLTS